MLVVFVGALARELILGERQLDLAATRAGAAHASARGFCRALPPPRCSVFALIVPIIFYHNRYLLDLGIMILTYVMLGWGLNIVVGLAGLLDLGYVAFYAVGAYSYALLAEHFGFSFWLCLPLAGILASFWGILLGFPVLRLRGDYLAIVTLAFGEIIRLVLLNWQSLTHGPDGISGVPRPSFFGMPFSRGDDGFAHTFGLQYSYTHRIVFLYYLILVLALITNLVTIRLRRLPIGRAWEALREDEIACRSLGINTTNTKLTAFAMGAMFAGFAGSFFATRQGFISPESFTFTESAMVLAIVVLGGMGSQIGVAVAAAAMLGGFEFFREFAQYRMLVFGLAMVVIMIWRPRGLVATRTPSIFLGKHHDVDAEIVRRARTQDLVAEAAAQCLTRADTILAVEHLSMRFGGLVAVSDLSFAARRGEITALIGPNGAGKTTVFNCITGFYKPTVGMIRLTHGDGTVFLLERLFDFRIAKLARVARTFQNIRLFAGMTALENLMVAQHNPLMRASGMTVLGMLGLSRFTAAERAAADKARYWLDRIGLIERADDPAGALPYGAQRRLEIARAMCADPVLLVPRRAGRRPQRARERRAQRAPAVHPQRARHLDPADRARHVGGDGNLRPHRRARLRASRSPTAARPQVRDDPKVIAAYLGVDDEELEDAHAEAGL